MSTLSDVQDLYGGARSTWTKSQAHIIAHVVLVLVIFAICRATVPELTTARLNLQQITNNEWYKLAKETGLVYVSLAIPVIALAVYVALLGTLGQLLVAAVIVIFPPSSRRNRFRLVNAYTIEPLALTLKKKDFELNDLVIKSGQLATKYQSKDSKTWYAYQKQIDKLTKNSMEYFGDFLIFVLAWIILFKATPHTTWTVLNQSRFWPVLLLLVGLALFAWFRVSSAVAALPTLLIIFVSMMLLSDPESAPLLEVADEDRDQVRQRFEELLQKEQNAADLRPSLRRFLYHRLNYLPTTQGTEESGQRRGLPFRALYERGFRFSWDKEQYERYDSAWLRGYFAYLYYELHLQLSNLGKTIWHLIRYLVTGAP